MTSSANPERSVTTRTFVAEAVRSVTAGVLETAFATFAILIAVTQFSSETIVKPTPFGSQAIGMIGSLMIVPLVIHLRLEEKTKFRPLLFEFGLIPDVPFG